VEIQLLQLVEEPVRQASRLSEPGKPALLLEALGLADFVIGGRQWSHGASSPSGEVLLRDENILWHAERQYGDRARNRRRKYQLVPGENVQRVGEPVKSD